MSNCDLRSRVLGLRFRASGSMNDGKDDGTSYTLGILSGLQHVQRFMEIARARARAPFLDRINSLFDTSSLT